MEDLAFEIIVAFVVLVVLTGLAYLAYLLLSLPLRRQERGRLLLDLVELGLKQGQTAEHTVCSAAQGGDRALGVRFHLLAAWLETGLRLDQALARVPRLLPPAVSAMLGVGAELGDLQKVLGACRQRLEDGVAQVFKSQHYLIVVLLMASPVWIAVFTTLMVFVMPRFVAIAQDIEVAALPGCFIFLAEHSTALIATQVSLVLLFYLGALAYVGGPRLARWVNTLVPGLPDWIALRLPWRRKRLFRDFAAMLAVLLDAGVPEPRAVRLAADGTDNRVLRRRAAALVAELERGVPLAQALRHLDDAGEFRWRLENAAHVPGAFGVALAGWQEALAAKAFQLEQTAAQIVTTGLVLLNGVWVGLLAATVFGLLIAILEQAGLW